MKIKNVIIWRQIRCVRFLKTIVFFAVVVGPCFAQFGIFDSGSTGVDGILNPASNLQIDMADHPDGIYHYERVEIPEGVTVTFVPNANNSPVTWLVQGDCIIAGTVDVSGSDGGVPNTGPAPGEPGLGGPGGYRGGYGGSRIPVGPVDTRDPEVGQGPGGGNVESGTRLAGGPGSFGTTGNTSRNHPEGAVSEHMIPWN